MFIKCQRSARKKIAAFGGHGTLFPSLPRCCDVKCVCFWESSVSQQPVFPSLSLLVELSVASVVGFRVITLTDVLLYRRARTFPEVVTPWKSFSPTFPSSCFFWSWVGLPEFHTVSSNLCSSILAHICRVLSPTLPNEADLENSTCHLAEICNVLLITSTISSAHEASALNPQAWFLPMVFPRLDFYCGLYSPFFSDKF